MWLAIGLGYLVVAALAYSLGRRRGREHARPEVRNVRSEQPVTAPVAVAQQPIVRMTGDPPRIAPMTSQPRGPDASPPGFR